MPQNENYSKEQQRCLARIGVLGYSVGNYLPQECTWELSKQDIIEIVLRLSRPYLSDIDSITLGLTNIEVRASDGKKEMIKVPAAYVWLPEDSPNLVDMSLKNSDSSIKFPIQKYSEKLKEYAAKFSDTKEVRLLKGELAGGDRGRRYKDKPKVGIAVLVAKLLRIEFDENNIKYGKEFGEEFKRNTSLEISHKAIELGGGDYDIQTIRVRKYIRKKNIVTGELRPRKSFNAR